MQGFDYLAWSVVGLQVGFFTLALPCMHSCPVNLYTMSSLCL